MDELKGKKPQNWLAKIIYSANESGWCVKTVCTTCGASEYRSAIVRGALEEAKEDVSRYTDNCSGRLVRPLLRDLPSNEKTAAIREIANALRAVEDVSGLWSALAVILIDLDEQYVTDPSGETLDDLLEGTAIGEMLASMRTHHANLVAERRKREETEQQNREQKYERSLNEYLRGCALAEAKGNPWPPIPTRVAKATMFETEDELKAFVTSHKAFQDYLADLQDLP